MAHEKMDNPLGFTKEVSSLLTGLGCSNLTQFRKKDIGLDDIKYLTKEDLVVLAEVGDTFDHKSFKTMCASMIRKSNIDNTPKPADIIKILHNEQKQLQLFEIYLKILYKLMSQNKDDFILDKDKNMKASEGLMLGCQSVIGRLDDLLEDALPKKSQNRGNKIVYGLIAGGIGVVVLVYIFR